MDTKRSIVNLTDCTMLNVEYSQAITSYILSQCIVLGCCKPVNFKKQIHFWWNIMTSTSFKIAQTLHISKYCRKCIDHLGLSLSALQFEIYNI